MLKEYCDRCGDEIKRVRFPIGTPPGFAKEVWLNSEFQEWGFVRRKYVICYKCKKALRKFMNDPSRWNEEGEEIID